MTELPSGWERRVLGEIAQTQLGKMLNSAKQTGVSGMPYLRNINVRWGSISLDDVKVMDVYEEERDKFTLKEGDLLVCEGGEPGRSAVWQLDAEIAFQNAIHRVRVAEGYSPDFIGMQFEWLARGGALDQFFTGVTIKHFPQQKLRRVPLVAPSLSEQEEIVRILDTQLARLDIVLEAVQAVRDRVDQLRRSLLHAAFTGQLTQPHRSHTANFPEGWSSDRLSRILEERFDGKKIQQGWSPKCESRPATEGEWGVLKTTAIQEGLFLAEHNKRLPDSLEPRPHMEVEPRDLLITSGGPRSRCGVACLVRTTQSKLLVSDKMYRFRPDESRVLSEFLEFALLAPEGKEQIDLMKTGANESGLRLTQSRFLEFQLTFPPLKEQQKIIGILGTQIARLDKALEVADRVEVECGRLRRSLLQAAFTGELTKKWREANG